MDTPPSANQDALLTAVRGARIEILAFVPLLNNINLASLLRAAKSERGVKVYLLTPSESYWNKGSFTGWLSAQGVALYARPKLKSDAFVVIDQRYAFVGPGVGEPNLLYAQRLRFIESGPELTGRYNWAVDQIKGLNPLKFADQLDKIRPKSQR